MHCDDVIRELAVPTDDRDSEALASHLASCPHCSGWARKDAQFDRLWNATRPIEPSAQVWETVWSHIASSLDGATSTQTKAFHGSHATLNGSVALVEMPFGSSSILRGGRSRNWAAVALIGLAQAAAVLFAVGYGWQVSTRSSGPELLGKTNTRASRPDSLLKAKALTPVLTPVVEIEAGQSVVIRIDDTSSKVLVLTPDGISSSVDDWYLVFNAIEAIANPVIAMKE